jgi:threonine/homoserine/homoserine lactone efflux protein
VTLTAALLGFAALAALLTITPGLDTALVLRSALVQGRRLAIATGLGIITGAFVWGVAASVGLAALLRASEVAFTVLRLVGAAYMIFLGARMLWTRVIRPRGDDDTAAVDARLPRYWWGSFGKGLATNLLNPKVGAFYIAVLPQFIPPGSNELLMGVVLAGIHGVETAAWFTLIIFGASSVRRWLQRRAVRRAIDGVTGAALIGFGIKLAVSAK